jgi:hypothetical protein
MQAGWIFDQLKSKVGGLQPSEVSTDFTSDSLSMLSDLCLAQAQYLFYRKAVGAGMKAGILSKTSMQVADYFKNAYQHSQTNAGIKQYDSGRFAGVMHYHSYYFESMAYLCLAIDSYKQVETTSRGMGVAIGFY